MTATASASSGTNFDIALSWTAPTQGLPITDYVIEYCKSSSNGVCGASWQVYDDGVSVATQADLDDFPASSSAYYAFRVKARNGSGDGDYSDIATVDTSFVSLNLLSSVVNLDIEAHPTQARFSSGKHDLSVLTNSTGGFRLSLSMAGDHNDLVHTADSSKKVPATTGSLSSPRLDLADNTWGYSLNTAIFNNTNMVETNQASSQFKWASVPVKNSPDAIQETSSANYDSAP